MKEILPPKVKEIGSSLSEKGKENPEKVNSAEAKEVSGISEKVNPAEAKEVSEISEKIVFDADIETAKNSSLEAILEENREKKMGLEIAPDDMHEVKEGKEGLSGEQKERLQEITGWSDEITGSIRSWKEAEIYMDIDTLKEMEINGKKILGRDKIDLNKKDEDGITNRQRMERGRPPITESGEDLELHHIGQKQGSPFSELTEKEHRGAGNDAILHDKTKSSEIDRMQFAGERNNHWKTRLKMMEGE